MSKVMAEQMTINTATEAATAKEKMHQPPDGGFEVAEKMYQPPDGEFEVAEKNTSFRLLDGGGVVSVGPVALIPILIHFRVTRSTGHTGCDP